MKSCSLHAWPFQRGNFRVSVIQRRRQKGSQLYRSFWPLVQSHSAMSVSQIACTCCVGLHKPFVSAKSRSKKIICTTLYTSHNIGEIALHVSGAHSFYFPVCVHSNSTKKKNLKLGLPCRIFGLMWRNNRGSTASCCMWPTWTSRPPLTPWTETSLGSFSRALESLSNSLWPWHQNRLQGASRGQNVTPLPSTSGVRQGGFTTPNLFNVMIDYWLNSMTKRCPDLHSTTFTSPTSGMQTTSWTSYGLGHPRLQPIGWPPHLSSWSPSL